MRSLSNFLPINGPNFFKLFVIIGSILLLVGCNNDKIAILNGIPQSTANQIMLQLGQNNIDCSTQIEKDGSYAILISKSDKLNALSILQANGEPSKSFASMGEIFKKDGFISSPVEEQGRMIFALEQQISAMLSKINGVTDVKTQVSLPPPSENLWQDATVSPAASVLIKYKPGYRIDLYVNRIKQLVANSVPGLSPDHVEVLTIINKNIGR